MKTIRKIILQFLGVLAFILLVSVKVNAETPGCSVATLNCCNGETAMVLVCEKGDLEVWLCIYCDNCEDGQE